METFSSAPEEILTPSETRARQSLPEIVLAARALAIKPAIMLPTCMVARNLESSLVTAPPSTVSDLKSLTASFATAPSPASLLMSGSAEIENATANIQLIRAVSKIEITGKNNFIITSVTVMNTPDRGYVFNQGTPSVPVSATRTSYPVVTSPTPILYVAESTIGNPVQFEVVGKYDGNEAKYTFSITDNREPVNIVRNTHYQVNITPITEDECIVTFIIPDWEDETADNYVIVYTPPNSYKKGIKILAIGNSYSENSLQYMADLLLQLGIGEGNKANIKLVNAYIAGGTLKNHADNARNNTSINLYRQTYNESGIATNVGGFTLQQLIKEDDWDVITLQQASEDSGDPDTYNIDLVYLIDYVNTNATNPKFKLGWHMTWAYAESYITGNVNYTDLYGNQDGMYHAICNTVQDKISPKPDGAFDYIIPTGTAIQNARTHYSDEEISYDGSHLENLGCYIASAMWIKTITGYDIAKLTTPYPMYLEWDEILYGPSPTETTINASTLLKVVEAVNAAATNPFEITPIE